MGFFKQCQSDKLKSSDQVFIKRFRVFRLALFIVLSASLGADARSQAPRKGWIADRIEDIDFEVSTGISANLLPFLKVRGDIGTGLKKGYEPNQFIRKYSYGVGTGFSISELLAKASYPISPIGVTLSKTAKVEYYRVFKSQREALASRVLHPAHYWPLSDQGFKNLPDGTIVSLPVETSFGISTGTAQGFIGTLPHSVAMSKITGEWMATGKFQLVIHKQGKDQVRLRVIADKSAGTRLTYSVGGVPTFFKSTVGDKIGGAVDSQLKASLIEGTLKSQTKGTFALADYEYNLKDPGAKQAYEQAIGLYAKQKDSQAMVATRHAPDNAKRAIASLLHPSLKKSEELAEKNQEMKISHVVRNFSGDNQYDRRGTSVGANWLLYKFKNSEKTTVNHIQYTETRPGPDAARQVLVVNHVSYRDRGFLAGIERETSRNENYFLSKGNRQKSKAIDDIDEFGQNLEVRDRALSRSNVKEIKAKLYKSLRPELFRGLEPELNKIEQSILKGRKAASIQVQAKMSPQILEHANAALAGLSGKSLEAYIEKELRQYIRTLESHPYGKVRGSFFGLLKGYQIKTAARGIASVFEESPNSSLWSKVKTKLGNKPGDKVSRLEKLSELNGNKVFGQISNGFLIHLARLKNSRLNLNQLVHLEIKYTIRGQEEVQKVVNHGDGPGVINQFNEMIQLMDSSLSPELMFRKQGCVKR